MQLRLTGLHNSMRAGIAALILGGSANAFAEGEQRPLFSISGFGTLGLAHSTEDKADFLANDLQAHGAGHSREWSPDVDSRLGLQLIVNVTPQLSGTFQAVSEQRHDGGFDPVIEWANIKYAVTPELSVRAGRILLPSFLHADSRKVGYAQPWVRPPVEVYSLVPITNNNGLDLNYQLRHGEVNHTIQLAYGNTEASVPDGGKVISRDGWLITNTLEYGSTTLRLAHGQSKFTLEPFRPLFQQYRLFAANAAQTAAMLPEPLAAGLRQTAAQANAIADKYDPDNKKLRFTSLAASYDPGKWFLMGEWGQTDTNSVFGKREAWYVTSGMRIGKYTPYLTYAETKLKSNSRDPGITAVPNHPALTRLSAGASMLNAVLNELLAGAPVQKTISTGLRWDFAKSAALKIQYDYSDIGAGSPGTLDHAQPGFVPGRHFQVVSFVLDFVF